MNTIRSSIADVAILVAAVVAAAVALVAAA